MTASIRNPTSPVTVAKKKNSSCMAKHSIPRHAAARKDRIVVVGNKSNLRSQRQKQQQQQRRRRKNVHFAPMVCVSMYEDDKCKRKDKLWYSREEYTHFEQERRWTLWMLREAKMRKDAGRPDYHLDARQFTASGLEDLLTPGQAKRREYLKLRHSKHVLTQQYVYHQKKAAAAAKAETNAHAHAQQAQQQRIPIPDMDELLEMVSKKYSAESSACAVRRGKHKSY